MRNLTYRILLNKEPEGGYTVSVPTLPGCITYGESIDEAILMAREAISLYIESLVAHNEPIPDESNILEYTLTFDTAERVVVPMKNKSLPAGTMYAILKQAGIDKDNL